MERRTDLAVEAHELAGGDLSGVEYTQQKEEDIEISKLIIKTHKASIKLKKEQGTYITIDIPSLTDNAIANENNIKIISREIARLLPVNGLVLVCGLGNKEITPDALGPKTVSRVLATRHITGEIARSTGLDKLRPVAVLSTGVTGQTGIETYEYIDSIVKKVRPTAVIVIDALASRRINRLGCTVQISDTGICPGAGVQNHRKKISADTLGIPVIAIGVPTVVDAVTLVVDMLNIDDGKTTEQIKKELTPKDKQMVVTPKEIDLLIDRASRLVSMAINCSLHKDIDVSVLEGLL